MSYIHEALKKAEKRRQGTQTKYESLLKACRGGNRSYLRSGRLVMVGLLFLGALAVYIWTPTWAPGKSDKAMSPAPSQPERGLTKAQRSYTRAKMLHEKGRIEEARRLYSKTLALDPGCVDALNNLGVIHLQRKAYSSARRYLEKAVHLDPDHVDPYYNLACVYASEGKIEPSLAYLKKAVSLDEEVKSWAGQDPDLEGLSGNPEFEAVVSGRAVTGGAP